MSGFAGVFHLDGAPVDRTWLETMAEFLSFRGPDGTEVWTSGSAGLCHTLLRTRAEHDGRPQIASLDDKFFLAGDVRIDDRETLLSKFSNHSPKLKESSSAELILHAYAKWGDACVEHLLGDFSFVIWDVQRQRVFLARDHLGVKLLFYAMVGSCLIISNTQECIRQIPIVSDKLNDQAIGDYLLTGMNYDPTTTFFTNVRRLAPAHRSIFEREKSRIERYWSPPIDEPLYHKRSSDYIDKFRELLLTAVRDRLPDGSVGIFMSGGLDSPAVAAAAVQLGADTTAFTSVYDRLIPDEERHYSGLVAKQLGIPIVYNVRDDELWGWSADSALIRTTEPTENSFGLAALEKFERELVTNARVFFFGVGPDAALFYEWRTHLTYLINQRRWGRVCMDLALHAFTQRRIPLLPTIPQMWRERKSNQPDWYELTLPKWLNPEFISLLMLKDRLKEILDQETSSHQIRPRAHISFAGNFPLCGNTNDAGIHGRPWETLQPFADLRLLRFLMAVPAVPWCRDKYLIRTALRGWIPERVRLRPKSPVPGFPYILRAQAFERPELPPHPALPHYLDESKLPKWPGRTREKFDSIAKAMGLHYWLVSLNSSQES
ncbi:MAG: asparagine synthetase B family protein [Pyrinomonadaceae bacterium]